MESDNVLWNQEELLVSGSVPLDLGYTNTLFLSLLNAWMLVTLRWSGGCTGIWCTVQKVLSSPVFHKLLEGEAQGQPHLLFYVLRIAFFVLKL